MLDNAKIRTDTVWGPAGSPYVIRNTLYVMPNVSLTILPGTVVKFDGAMAMLSVTGSLFALGTPTHHVVFTSYKDDSVAGDTNGDGGATSPARADWTNISISGVSGEMSTSVIDYADIRYGGYGSSVISMCQGPGLVNITTDNVKVIVSNSELTDSKRDGVLVSSVDGPRSQVGVYNNHFARSGCGVSVYSSRGAQIVGNTVDASMDSYGLFANGAKTMRAWFNIMYGTTAVVGSAGTVTRPAAADVRFNAFYGAVGYFVHSQNLDDYSYNFWGTAPPSYLNVVPKLSGPPGTIPSALLDAAAPRFGPVNTYTGGLTYQVDDLTVQDAGKQFTANRVYRSDGSGSDDLGSGWASSFSESLATANGVSTMALADGRSVAFGIDPVAGYVPVPGVSASFSAGADGATVTSPDQTSYQFDPSGQLTGMLLGDKGHKLTIDRTGSGELSAITGISGRSLTYNRSNGRLTSVEQTADRKVSFVYASGQLAAATGLDGEAETYAYDSSNRLVSVTTPMGRAKLRVGYDDSGRVAWVEQMGSGRATVQYDGSGRRTTVTTADGTVITQEYDSQGRLVVEGPQGGPARHVVYDAEGRVVVDVTGVPSTAMTGYGPITASTVFDANGDPFVRADAMGHTTATTFNSAHKPTSVIYPDGSTSSKTYDSDGRLASATDQRGQTWSYAFDSHGQPLSVTDPLNRTTSWTYEADGDLQSMRDETGASTTYEHDGYGRLTSATDALNGTTTYGYTAWDAQKSVRRPGAGTYSNAYDADRDLTATTAPNGGVTTIEYDDGGRVVARVDAAGGRTAIAYDDLGRPTRVTDARGNATVRTYTTSGWTTTITDALGAVTKSQYDPAGRPIRVTDATGAVTQTIFDRGGHPLSVQTPDGSTRSYVYDALGRMSQSTTPRGNVWKQSYLPTGQASATTDPLGKTIVMSYDAVGRPTSRVDENGATTSISYDDANRTQTVSDVLGTISVVKTDELGRTIATTDGRGKTVRFAYDADGDLISTTDASGATTQGDYDAAGRLVTLTDPLGNQSKIAYDEMDRVTKVIRPDDAFEAFSYDSNGNMTLRTDPSGAEWHAAFDAANRMTSSTDPLGYITSYIYDALGRLLTTTDPTGVLAGTAYDPVGRPAVHYDTTGASWVDTFDGDGNVTKSTDPAGVVITNTYDKRNRLTKTATTQTSITTGYDGVGNVISRQRGSSVAATFEYDQRRRLTASVDPLANRTKYAYDEAGNQVSRTTPLSHATTWTYDATGRLSSATDPLGAVSAYEYDDAGNLTTLTLPKGGKYAYTYDAMVRLQSEKNPLGATTTYEYDADDRLVKTTKPSGAEVTSTYDGAGNLVATQAGSEQRSFGYDDANRLTSAANVAGTLTYAYDNRGLMSSTASPLGAVTYGYDAAGRLNQQSWPGGAAATYTYNTAGLVATVRGTTNLNYSYNTNGWLSSKSGASGTSDSESIGYNANGQILSRQPTGTKYSSTAAYNADGRMNSLAQNPAGNAAANTTAYAYDENGRLTSAELSRSGAVVGTTTYGWDDDGNRTSVAATGQPTATTDYNAADQATSDSDGTTYSYTQDGQLSQVAKSGGAHTTYGYNDFGELIDATVDGTPVSYQRDALGRVINRASGSSSQTYQYGTSGPELSSSRRASGARTDLVRDPSGDLLAAATTSSSTQHVLPTIHGDVGALTVEATGTVSQTAVYDAFGTAMTTGTSLPQPLGFQSMPVDTTTGMVDMGARSFQPTTGRFITADTVIGDLTMPVSLNRYSYGNADPLDYFDPDGHWPKWVDDRIDDVKHVVSTVVDKVEDVTSTVVHAVGDVGSAVADAVSGAASTVVDWAEDTVTAAAAYISDAAKVVADEASQVASDVSKAVSYVWHNPSQVLKMAEAAVTGLVVFGGCEALSFGAATPACVILASAAGGGVYGALDCPPGKAILSCAATGAAAGGAAGAVGLIPGLNAFAIGALSSGAFDATSQLLSTGHIDGSQLVASMVLGGAAGAIPGLSKSAATKWQRSGTTPANVTAYSVAFEAELPADVFGRSRSVHFNRANAALDEALKSDPAFAAGMEQLIPGAGSSVARTGGRTTPDGWVWHHAPTAGAQDRMGVMQLVPTTQHFPGSPRWPVFHPGGIGGYAEWAIPRGAPPN